MVFVVLQDILGDDGVFILPTHPIPAYYHGQFTMKTAGVGFTMIFNTLEMPATHVPMGLNKDGLPIGVQVQTFLQQTNNETMFIDNTVHLDEILSNEI